MEEADCIVRFDAIKYLILLKHIIDKLQANITKKTGENEQIQEGERDKIGSLLAHTIKKKMRIYK